MVEEVSVETGEATLATRQQARRLAMALDAIEQRLAGLGHGADPDAIAAALAEPVRAFDLAAKEA